MGGTLKDVRAIAALLAASVVEMGTEFEDMDSPWAKGERGCGIGSQA
jgi:hypothetical protein